MVTCLNRFHAFNFGLTYNSEIKIKIIATTEVSKIVVAKVAAAEVVVARAAPSPNPPSVMKQRQKNIF